MLGASREWCVLSFIMYRAWKDNKKDQNLYTYLNMYLLKKDFLSCIIILFTPIFILSFIKRLCISVVPASYNIYSLYLGQIKIRCYEAVLPMLLGLGQAQTQGYQHARSIHLGLPLLSVKAFPPQSLCWLLMPGNEDVTYKSVGN